MARILMVDDDEDFTNAVAEVMRDAGHEVVIHLETGGVIQSIEEGGADLVILDVMFPEDPSGGLTLLRELRQGVGEGIPVLLLTGVNARFPLGFSREDVEESGFIDVDLVEKPVDMRILRRRVELALGKGSDADRR